MSLFVSDYFPSDRIGVWISTEIVEPLDYKSLGRLQYCLDNEAETACKNARVSMTRIVGVGAINPGDRVLVYEDTTEDDIPRYRTFYYGGTKEEYIQRQIERLQKEEQEQKDSEQRWNDHVKKVCSRPKDDWQLGFDD
jgi:hypothetical protein